MFIRKGLLVGLVLGMLLSQNSGLMAGHKKKANKVNTEQNNKKVNAQNNKKVKKAKPEMVKNTKPSLRTRTRSFFSNLWYKIRNPRHAKVLQQHEAGKTIKNRDNKTEMGKTAKKTTKKVKSKKTKKNGKENRKVRPFVS